MSEWNVCVTVCAGWPAYMNTQRERENHTSLFLLVSCCFSRGESSEKDKRKIIITKKGTHTHNHQRDIIWESLKEREKPDRCVRHCH